MSDGVRVGYARVSTAGQSLDVQTEALKAAGVAEENIFEEKRSGTTADRPKLKELQRFVRKGDTVVVTKLDRLGRSLNDLSSIVEGFRKDGVAFVVLDQGIDTSTSAGRALFGMLATFAEFETDIRRERQMEGIAKAKAKGVQFGRKRTVEPEAVVAAYREHGTIGATAKAVGSTKPTVHRVLKEAGVDTSGKQVSALAGRSRP
ncbi:MAG: recombinase family protein [Pseudomonadota bacterium]